MTTIFCLKKRCRHLFKVVLCEVALWKYRFNYCSCQSEFLAFSFKETLDLIFKRLLARFAEVHVDEVVVPPIFTASAGAGDGGLS